MWNGWGPMVGSCENSNEHLCSIKDDEFLDYLRDSAPWSVLEQTQSI
jgi:hypothetical protein